jgi:XXXCH domain-containing protein
MKITLEANRSNILVKIKYKVSGQRMAGAKGDKVDGLLAYRRLKRRMRGTFKEIFTLVHEDRLPPRETVDSFLADSALMVTFPGLGAPYYREYERACLAFAQAYERADMGLLHQTCDQLDQIKSHCHNRYK